MDVTILLIIAQILIGIYFCGIGFKLIPYPGKKGSLKNKNYFYKYSSLFKFTGIAAITFSFLKILELTIN